MVGCGIRGWAASAACCLLFCLSAAAVQPLFRVDADLIFLPQDGLALNAHTGAVAWRYPRFNGQTYTDGHGLLLVGWVTEIRHATQQRFTRFCRLRTRDGVPLWCRDVPAVMQWRVDAAGRFWYILFPHALAVMDTGNGQVDRNFSLSSDSDQELLPLPARGALVLDRSRGKAEAYTYRPGAAGLTVESLPGSVYAFQGDGRGLLFYTRDDARDEGEFWLASPLTALFHRAASELHGSAPAPRRFPEVRLDDQAFLVADAEAGAPRLRGGRYGGPTWQQPGGGPEARLALGGQAAALLEPLPARPAARAKDTAALAGAETFAAPGSAAAAGARLTVLDPASGRTRFQEILDADFPALDCDQGQVFLQNGDQIRSLDAASGAELWRVQQREGPLAAIAATALIYWESGGELAALARNNGALLWRIRFQATGLQPPF